MNGAELVWTGAGRPEEPTVTDAPAGRCWWCAELLRGRGAPRAIVPDTFPDAPIAACRSSAWLCPACAWAISGDAALPPGTTAGTLARRLAAGGRVVARIAGSEPTRRLVLRLASGRIGLWSTGTNAAAEEPWTAAVAELRDEPRDIGPCAFLGDVAEEDVVVEDRGAMRLYHHIGTAARWEVCMSDAAGRARLRAFLCDPPTEPWVCSIGDGQKHCLPRAEVSDGRSPTQIVGLVGLPAVYAPATLRDALRAWRELLFLGAFDAEIMSGRYKPAQLVAGARTLDRAIAPLRDHPTLLDLAALLRESRTDLRIA